MISARSWALFVSSRFGKADSRGRSAVTGTLSALGIALGVAALIVILSVMNGFQMGYIESILEVSSAHARLSGGTEADYARAAGLPGVRALTVFTEAQALVEGRYGRQQGALLRAVDPDIEDRDPLFAARARVENGRFDLRPGSIVLGCELARFLQVSVGDTVNVLAVSGTSETDLVPADGELRVRGTVRTGYYEIDTSFAFVSRADGVRLLGPEAPLIAAVKLDDVEGDAAYRALVERDLPNVNTESWRDYNRSFFGALKSEKSMLLTLVVLIFLVVTVNVYHSMRRSVYERREEICVLSALGSSSRDIQLVFIANGLSVGLAGSSFGLAAGLFLSVRINEVFDATERVVNAFIRFAGSLVGGGADASFSIFSPANFYLTEVPTRILFPEVLFVYLFGALSAAAAAWAASGAILKLTPAEVLRYE